LTRGGGPPILARPNRRGRRGASTMIARRHDEVPRSQWSNRVPAVAVESTGCPAPASPRVCSPDSKHTLPRPSVSPQDLPGEGGGRLSSGRRRFMTQAGTVVAATVTAIVTSPHVVAQPKVQWRMPTASGPARDRHRGVAERLTKVVGDTRGGRFRIDVFPGGLIVEPFDCFVAEEAHGEEARVLHEVPGAGRPVGPRGRRCPTGSRRGEETA
jgi:hypothetical protein